MKPSVIVVGGPTASGKSQLAAEIARDVGGVVLSADSISVYEGCDIVAAKPTIAEQQDVSHQLLSFFSPGEQFDVAKFVSCATQKIAELHKVGLVPIICGGTGLYIRSLLGGLVETPQIADSVRAEVSERERIFLGDGDEAGRIRMHLWLQSLDPDRAAELSPRDLVRVRRSLLVALSSDRPLSELHRAHGNREQPWRALVISLLPSREALYARIDQRVEEMLLGGGIEEVRRLREQYGDGAPALRGIGYRHIAEYLRGEAEYAAMEERLKRDTRRLAKRQYTWWRNEPEKLGWRKVATGDALGSNLVATVRAYCAHASQFATEDIYYLSLGPN